MTTPRAAVVIVTKNRKEELRVALRSAARQTASPELIVIDDGSTDGTADLVRQEFPAARLIRHETSKGLIARRNEGAHDATAPIIFSIDDDAEFVSPHTVEQTLADFGDDRIGAVAIPFVEPRKGGDEFQRAPTRDGMWITDCFIGTAHALRKDVFLTLGGYRERLFHQGEERDYCLRMLADGHLVRLGNADALHHYESPKRDMSRMDYYGRRNDILFAWHYVPLVHVLPHLAGTTINAVVSAIRAGRFANMLKGTAAGYLDILGHRGERAPVSSRIYSLHRRLKKQGPHKLECLAI